MCKSTTKRIFFKLKYIKHTQLRPTKDGVTAPAHSVWLTGGLQEVQYRTTTLKMCITWQKVQRPHSAESSDWSNTWFNSDQVEFVLSFLFDHWFISFLLFFFFFGINLTRSWHFLQQFWRKKGLYVNCSQTGELKFEQDVPPIICPLILCNFATLKSIFTYLGLVNSKIFSPKDNFTSLK